MAVIIGWSILPSRLRVLGVLLAAGTLLLSQSRGATVALVVAAAVAVALAFALGHVSPARFARAAISLVVVLGIVVAAVVVIGLPTAEIQRFSSLLAVLSQGPQADANLAGRLDYWQAVTALNAFYPWGTLGAAGAAPRDGRRQQLVPGLRPGVGAVRRGARPAARVDGRRWPARATASSCSSWPSSSRWPGSPRRPSAIRRSSCSGSCSGPRSSSRSRRRCGPRAAAARSLADGEARRRPGERAVGGESTG